MQWAQWLFLSAVVVVVAAEVGSHGPDSSTIKRDNARDTALDDGGDDTLRSAVVDACAATLDALHAAAARSDGDAYFDLFAAEARRETMRRPPLHR